MISSTLLCSRLKQLLIENLAFRLLMVWVFDGHVWNMKLLDPDVFTSFSIAAMTELPAAILLAIFLDRWGRRWMGFASMFMCGMFSFIALITPPGKLYNCRNNYSHFTEIYFILSRKIAPLTSIER